MKKKALLAILVLAALLAACRPSPIASEMKSVRGLVIDVVSTSITETESFVIRMEDGKELTFKAEGFLGMTPSHLKEHGAVGEQVTVSYKETPGGFIATKVTD